MNDVITKPMSVARHDFAEKLIDIINNSQLPLFVIEPILQNALDAVKATAQKQYEIEKAQYEEKLNQIESNEN